MVQMSGPDSRNKQDRPSSATEAPSLLTTSNSEELESAAYGTSPGGEGRMMTIESVDVDTAKPLPNANVPVVSDPFDFDEGKTNAISDMDAHCEDIKPSHVCRACQASFTNAAKLEFHLTEKHLNFHSRPKRNPKPKNRHNFQFPSKLYPLTLPSNKGSEAILTNSITGESATFARTEATPLASQSSKEPKIRKSPIYPRKRKSASATNFTISRRPKRKIREDSTAAVSMNSSSPAPLPTHCVLCNLSYQTYSAWKDHAINDHLLKKDPEPRVEMNYVDVQAIMLNEKELSSEASFITTAKISGTPGRGKVQEQLKLTFCREKGSYVVKNPSFSEELTGLHSSSNPIDENGRFDGDSVIEDGDTVTEDADTALTLVTEEGSSTGEIRASGGEDILEESPVSTLPIGEEKASPRKSGSKSGEINLLADKENNEPGFVGTITQNGSPGNGLVSKVPTCGTVVYLGSSASESDKTLARDSGNSHMVIIQNDILHIGADADEENIQRITAATTANTPHLNAKKTKEAMQATLNEDFNAEKGLQKGSPIVNILNMAPFSISMPKEVTTMVAEEILNNTGRVLDMKRTGTAIVNPEERTDESRGQTMEFHVAIGEEELSSPTDSQSHECVQQESPRELPLKESSSESSTDVVIPESQKKFSEVPNATATVMPMRITLPCGTQIEHLIPISPSRRQESNLSTVSEEIDVDDSGLGNSRTNELIIDEDASTEKETTEEAEDFRCKVCNVLFTSDEELETHFSASHFRGIANNILEPPESPYVGGPPETPHPPPPPAHSNSNGSGMLYRSLSTELVPTNFSMQGTHPLGSRSERRPSDPERHSGTTDLRMANGLLNAQLAMRIGEGGPTSSVLRSSSFVASSVSNGEKNSIPTRNAQFPHPQGDSLQSRLEINTSGYGAGMAPRPLGNLLIQQHRSQNPPSVTFRTSGMIPHSAYPPQQQPQIGLGNTPRTNYPNALHNALNSTVVQLQSQRPMGPMYTSVRPNSQDNVPRIVDVVSISQPVSSSRPSTQTSTHSQSQLPPQPNQQQRNQLQAIQHQRQQQQYQQLIQRQQQHEQQRVQQHQANVAELQRQQQQAAQEQQQRQIRSQQSQMHQYNLSHNQGKRPSPQELMSSVHKQRRLELQSHVTQESRPRSNTIPARIEPQSQPPTTTTSQLASSLGNGGVRLGTSITLSVCGDETRNASEQHGQNSSLFRTSIQSSQSQRSPNLGSAVNPNTVATALAVRGVTVSPASPTNSSSNLSENSSIPAHRLQSHLSISPNHVRANSSPTDIPNSVSVIQNGSAHANTPSPPSHQFVMPSNPAPRITSSSLPSVERPDRPPTVDLTADEMNAYQHGRYLERRVPIQSPGNQRPSNRPAVACNLCGVLFCSLANLEEHKIHRHGLRPAAAPPSSQSRDQRLPSPPLRVQQQQPPQQQQGLRTATTTFRTPGISQRSLFIPLLDLSRMDASKLKRLEELGVCSMIPLQGNDRQLGQMGIPLLLPTINLRDGQQLPWDQLQPVGPVFSPSQVAHAFGPGSRPLPPSLPNSSANH